MHLFPDPGYGEVPQEIEGNRKVIGVNPTQKRFSVIRDIHNMQIEWWKCKPFKT